MQASLNNVNKIVLATDYWSSSSAVLAIEPRNTIPSVEHIKQHVEELLLEQLVNVLLCVYTVSSQICK